MADISFRQVKDGMTGEVSTTQIMYIDEEGREWFTTLGVGHRFEDLYNAWLAEGHTVEPAA